MRLIICLFIVCLVCGVCSVRIFLSRTFRAVEEVDFVVFSLNFRGSGKVFRRGEGLR